MAKKMRPTNKAKAMAKKEQPEKNDTAKKKAVYAGPPVRITLPKFKKELAINGNWIRASVCWVPLGQGNLSFKYPAAAKDIIRIHQVEGAGIEPVNPTMEVTQ